MDHKSRGLRICRTNTQWQQQVVTDEQPQPLRSDQQQQVVVLVRSCAFPEKADPPTTLITLVAIVILRVVTTTNWEQLKGGLCLLQCLVGAQLHDKPRSTVLVQLAVSQMASPSPAYSKTGHSLSQVARQSDAGAVNKDGKCGRGNPSSATRRAAT
jgi:hypothetical protein